MRDDWRSTLGVPWRWRLLGRVGRRGRGSGLGVELGEELVRGGRAGAFATPHHLAAQMVDDEREVLVLALPGDFVKPDPLEA